ncbi:CRISPR-associated helicase Cas3' [Kitasatospora sp. NPDC004799]|uniref:CRISPR-associated helicase Cas3' n=1 Tax=Kitasatospora sp. NPDC004799 TaxID=3154460 RepID=UPI0033B90889
MEDSSSDVTPLWAHSRNLSGRRHTLEDHLRGSALLARQFGSAFNAGELAGYLALVHDVGKGSCAWQHGLHAAEAGGRRVGVPHKEAGAWLAASHAGRPFAAVVQGHHGGLPGYQDLQTLLTAVKSRTHKDQRLIEEAIAAVAAVLPEITPTGRVPLPQWLTGPSTPDAALARDLLLRMLFSCVVDADFLDTAAHFADLPPQLRPDTDMAALADLFEERRRQTLAARPPSPVDDIRQHIYQQAVTSATGTPGMYVLHVPTGGGKTLASAGFALRHAAAHGLRRVVVAVPYVSITQQNAQIYRDLLDPDDPALPPAVLEHHSSVDLDAPDTGRARTAAENWDAPFIVTTTVQLFESLFSHKPAAMRKLHRLAKSVIVLDEVQALPDHLLVPILSALRGLVERFGATVVLVSATQPDFWSLSQLHGLPRHQLVDDPADLFTALRRVTYDWRHGPHVTWESMAEEIAHDSGHQTLTVVNTTKDAARLHSLLAEQAPTPVLHLSTRMTAGHRRSTIERIRDMLKDGGDVHVVSTQLIEAGVDLDFPRVFRAWAPAESLQQAAGRCNRDGRLPEGTVVVFQVHDAGQPRDNIYEAALKATATHIGPGLADPDDLDALNRYYQLRYSLHGSSPATMGGDIDDLRTQLEFPDVDKAFRMINDEYSQPVVVIRDEADRDVIEADVAALRSPYPTGPEPLRRLQPHTASLPRHEAKAALAAGLAEPVIGDLLLWHGAYHPDRGLDPTEKEDRATFVV